MSNPQELQSLKYKQIDTLRQFFPTVREVIKESLYEVSVPLPNRTTITLRVHLEKDFPKSAPKVQVSPPSQHKFIVAPNFYVSPAAHDSLAKWSVNFSLGKTMYELVQKFSQDPPILLPSSASQPAPQQPPKPQPQPQQQQPQSQPQTGLYNSNYLQQQANVASPVMSAAPFSAIPPQANPAPVKEQPRIQSAQIPSSFPELQHKSGPELMQLLSDENEFSRFFDGLEAVKTSKRLRDDLKSQIEDSNKKILAKEAELERSRRDFASKQAQLNEKRTPLFQKIARQQEVMKQFSTASLIEKLNDSAAEAEHDSDTLAQRFTTGEVDLATFLKDFQAKRTNYHIRSAKKESLSLFKQDKS